MKTMYKCELCGRTYDSERLCAECEKICGKHKEVLENVFTRLFGTPLNKVEGIKDEIITSPALEDEIEDIKLINARLGCAFNESNITIAEIQAKLLNSCSLPKFVFEENSCGGSEILKSENKK